MDAASTPQSRPLDAPTLEREDPAHDPYQALFELAGVGLAQICPSSYRFLRVNRRLCEMTGYAEPELLNLTPIDITFPDDWQADRPAFQSLLAGDFTEHVVEKRYVRKDGSITWVMVTLNPVRDAGGNLLHLVSVVRDLDKRKRAEAQLHKRNRALTFLSDTATRLLMAERPEDLIPSIVSNLAAHLDMEIYAGHLYDATDGRLHLLSCSDTIDPDVRTRIQTMDLGQHASGTVALRREPLVFNDAQSSTDPASDLIRSIGVTAWVSHPLLAAGRLNGTLSFGTRRRQRLEPAELELVRTTCDQVAMALERRRLTLELEHRASDLSQANTAKDQFLAVLSHELRAPLTPVLLSASAMEADPSLPRVARDEMTSIRQNVELEARLIDDLLDLTRIARGKMELDLKPVGLHELIHHAIRTVASDARAKNLTLDHDLRAADDTTLADPTRLQQILLNLLKNAIKFTPDGGTIHIRTATAGPAARPSVVTEVSDTGIGIPPDMLPKIFEPFEQGTPSITRRFGGLGLGLAISRALAIAHSGTLAATSAGPGAGSTFTLTLPTTSCPAAHKTAAPPSASPQSENRNPQSLKILLVEDHASTASTLARLLRKLGHDVAVATGVRRALDLSSKSPFDLLICDIGLPDGSGHDLMRELRTTHPTLPGIALSGYGTDADIERSLAAGFSQHFTKPISIEQLKSLTVPSA